MSFEKCLSKNVFRKMSFEKCLNSEEFLDPPKGSRRQFPQPYFAPAGILGQLTIDPHCDFGHRDDNEPQFVFHDRALTHQSAGVFRSSGSTTIHQFGNAQTLATLGNRVAKKSSLLANNSLTLWTSISKGNSFCSIEDDIKTYVNRINYGNLKTRVALLF